ncbi:MAG: hypothetical protein ACOX2L_08800 [Anaerolineae bacterium]|jgi:hypothetical protein|nr:hypothetical protein [Chloroflexota bacterium]
MWDDLDEASTGAASPVSVLVAVVPSLTDWERIRREGWYRIPAARAPRRIAASYLAFYLPACFGPQRWSIRHYAAIQRYSLVTRRELLPEESAHPRAGDLYYRLQLGPLQTLPHPIISQKLRRVTFIHTDLEMLFSAHEIGQLWAHRSPREALWQALRISSPQAAYLLTGA